MNKKNEVVSLGKMFMYFSISLIFTCIGFLIGKSFIPENIVMMANSFIVILVVFLFLLTLSSRKQIIPQKFSMRFVYLFALIVGVLYYPILTHYFRDLGTITFVSITIGTSLLFIILTIVSYKKPEGYLQ